MNVRVLITALAALPLLFAQTARADSTNARYKLVHGCYALKAVESGKFVWKSGSTYVATATALAGAEPFRMQATDLGAYLFYGKAGDFLAADGDVAAAALQPSPQADWVVDGKGDAFTITLPAAGKALAVGKGGALELADAPAAFDFVRAEGCPEYPESEINVFGEPFEGEAPWAETRGWIDPHFHWMAFEFLGGSAHCGRPWHRYGIAFALVDCPDHEPNGEGAVLENILVNGSPYGTHDTDGWPSFTGWPRPESLTHEGSYHKWVERAWRAGLRLTTVLYVDNTVLCEVYPLKRNSCDEMESIRLQAADMRALVDYIDAQSGGPGKGWLRIVTDPFEAREVINEGKLAVVQGIETSRLFHCRELNGAHECDKESIDAELDAVHDLGIRQMEIVNKYDNALSGIAGDGGTTGLVVNNGNRYETGHFWRMGRCDGLPEHAHDKEQPTLPSQVSGDPVFEGVVDNYLPSGQTPIYAPGPHCNEAGLTDLGKHLIERMIEKGMLFDPDHMSARARVQALDLIEERGYGGVVSSHSWSTPDAYARILALGGVVTPITGNTKGFVEDWQTLRPLAAPKYYYGIGFGSDMNGLHSQPRPRNPQSDPVRYPFKSFDGGSTIDRQKAGTRTWDVNLDGVSHYGLLPDWIEDLRIVGGEELGEDLARGSEAYLQMWERAVGIDGDRCVAGTARLSASGIASVRLGARTDGLVRNAGQPESRDAEEYRFCVEGDDEPRVVAGLDSRGRVHVVGSRAPGHRAGGVAPGDVVGRLSGRARRVALGIYVRGTRGTRAFVYGVRKGRVSYVAVARRALTRDATRLRAALRAAGLR